MTSPTTTPTGATAGATADAVVFSAPRNVDVVAVPVPAPGDGEVQVRTSFSGISSGTEMLLYRGEVDPEMPLDERIGALGGTFSYPCRYGYSCVGTVERSRAASIAEGALVFAFHPHQAVFTTGADDVVMLGDVEPRAATLFPLVETALQVTLDAGPVMGLDVVVIGLGVVGLLVSVVLHDAGAHVLAADPLAWRREAAATLGVDAIAPEHLAGSVEARSKTGVPLVVEASGRPEALPASLALLAHEGVVLVVSWYGTKDVVLPLGAEFHRRRLTIRSTQVSTIPARLADRWTIARRRAAAGALLSALPLAPLATHTYPITEAATAFAAVDRAEPGLVHAALSY
jgi:2-desacetyl-2-hydroxyethyl bacteriochlorophyllide A dehydrogenase